MPTQTLSGAVGSVPPVTLDSGVPVQLNAAAIAAAAASNITPQTPAFTVQPRLDGGDHTLDLSAIGIGAIPTTVTANLLVSYDGGASWQLYGTSGTAIPLIAASVATAFQIKNVVAGPIYAISVSVLTLGAATGVNIVGSTS